MSAPAEIPPSKTPSRLKWLVIGIVAGMLLFPAAAGLDYGPSWDRVWTKTRETAPAVWAKAEPYVHRAWTSVKSAVRSARDSWGSHQGEPADQA